MLKDLPFGNLKAGAVIYKGGRGHGGQFSISRGNTYYQEGGSSHDGLIAFDDTEESILSAIWENEEWFEDATLSHIDVIPSTTCITLRFKAIDKEEAETLAKGIIHILPHLQDDSYTWNEFKDFTTAIRNN